MQAFSRRADRRGRGPRASTSFDHQLFAAPRVDHSKAVPCLEIPAIALSAPVRPDPKLAADRLDADRGSSSQKHRVPAHAPRTVQTLMALPVPILLRVTPATGHSWLWPIRSVRAIGWRLERDRATPLPVCGRLWFERARNLLADHELRSSRNVRRTAQERELRGIRAPCP